jgi:hypothetical protein
VENFAMALPQSVEPYFRAWIDVDTWHTYPDLDGFYEFVWAVHRNCRRREGVKESKKRLPSDEEIREAIIEARRGTFSEEHLERKAQELSYLYDRLLGFANTPNRSDPIIEKKDILAYRAKLVVDLGGDAAKPEHIAARMRQDWGDDWEQKLENARRRLG